jgi:hypothetical protein
MIAEFESMAQEDINKISEAAKEGGDPLGPQLDRYVSKFKELFIKIIDARSRTASAMITGPANFPTQKNRRALDTERKRYEEFNEWRAKALKAAIKNVQPVISEIDQVRRNLERREKFHIVMIEANRMIRAGVKDLQGFADKLEISLETAKKLLDPSQIGGAGFADYQLQNNRQEIARLKDRLAILETKEHLKNETGGLAIHSTFPGGKIAINYELDRVQIYHDQKPEPAKIEALKRAAFRWAPSVKCWQRKHTARALYDAERAVK